MTHELPDAPLAPLAVRILMRVADIPQRDGFELAMRSEDRREGRKLQHNTVATHLVVDT
jgi:hypothetical protein